MLQPAGPGELPSAQHNFISCRSQAQQKQGLRQAPAAADRAGLTPLKFECCLYNCTTADTPLLYKHCIQPAPLLPCSPCDTCRSASSYRYIIVGPPLLSDSPCKTQHVQITALPLVHIRCAASSDPSTCTTKKVHFNTTVCLQSPLMPTGCGQMHLPVLITTACRNSCPQCCPEVAQAELQLPCLPPPPPSAPAHTLLSDETQHPAISVLALEPQHVHIAALIHIIQLCPRHQLNIKVCCRCCLEVWLRWPVAPVRYQHCCAAAAAEGPEGLQQGLHQLMNIHHICSRAECAHKQTHVCNTRNLAHDANIQQRSHCHAHAWTSGVRAWLGGVGVLHSSGGCVPTGGQSMSDSSRRNGSPHATMKLNGGFSADTSSPHRCSTTAASGTPTQGA